MTAGTLPTNLVPHPRDEPLPGSITVLLAMELDLLRGALGSLLSRQADIEVVAALKCGDQVVRTARQKQPDVVVIEVDTTWVSSLATVRELRRWLPACQVVGLVAAKPAGLARHLLAADVLGAIDRNAPAARLLEAIRGAAKGQLVVDASLTAAALTAEANPLTSRESDILRLAAKGTSGPEIAKHLYLSPGTVRNNLSKAINKTRTQTRTDAIRIARDSGWI